MAKYALIIGLDITSPREGLRSGCAYKNTAEVYDSLRSRGYIPTRMIESYIPLSAVKHELEKFHKKLKKGDSFIFYYFGHAVHTVASQYILLGNRLDIYENSELCIAINSIKTYTDVDGVGRIIFLDTYSGWGETKVVEGITIGIDTNLIYKSISDTNSRSPNEISSRCPIGCYFRHSESLPPDGGSQFSRALVEALTLHTNRGLEFSFPSVCDLISKIFMEQGSNITPDAFVNPPRYVGDEVIIPIEQTPDSIRSDLSAKQKKVKRIADRLIDQICNQHEEWFMRGRDTDNRDHQLSWAKLGPLLEMYESVDLDPPTLANRLLSDADFTNARFPCGINLVGTAFSDSSFANAYLDNVDFSKCSMFRCKFEFTTAIQCNFSDSYLCSSIIQCSSFLDCTFDDAKMGSARITCNVMDGSSFTNADICNADVTYCSAYKSNFTNSYLFCSLLVGTDFSHSILTGAKLYGSARADWRIERVICEYVYWDREGKDRFPPDNDFVEGEFAAQYRPYTTFSHTFKDGFTPLDLILATKIVDGINDADLGFKIKIDNASVRGLNPTITFIMLEGDGQAQDAKDLVHLELSEKREEVQRIINEFGERLSEQEQLNESSTKQLVEINTRQNMLEKYFLAFISQNPRILDFDLSPEHIALIKNRQAAREGEKNSQEFEQATIIIQLCDKSHSVQVGEDVPVEFNSIKQYAVFKATLELSDKGYDGPANLTEIGRRAGEIDLQLTPQAVRERNGWQPISMPEDVSKVANRLRKYCNANLRLAFLKSLILQPRQSQLGLAKYKIESAASLSGARRISKY